MSEQKNKNSVPFIRAVINLGNACVIEAKDKKRVATVLTMTLATSAFLILGTGASSPCHADSSYRKLVTRMKEIPKENRYPIQQLVLNMDDACFFTGDNSRKVSTYARVYACMHVGYLATKAPIANLTGELDRPAKGKPDKNQNEILKGVGGLVEEVEKYENTKSTGISE